MARHQVIAYLNRTIASLGYLQTEAGTSSNDYDNQIKQLSFIKQKHCHLLQKRFEEVDLCLSQQKQEWKTHGDNLLKHKTEAAKLGLHVTLHCFSVGTTRIRTPNAFEMYMQQMYMQRLQEETFDDMKEALNVVDRNDRSLIDIKEGTIDYFVYYHGSGKRCFSTSLSNFEHVSCVVLFQCQNGVLALCLLKACYCKNIIRTECF